MGGFLPSAYVKADKQVAIAANAWKVCAADPSVCQVCQVCQICQFCQICHICQSVYAQVVPADKSKDFAVATLPDTDGEDESNQIKLKRNTELVMVDTTREPHLVIARHATRRHGKPVEYFNIDPADVQPVHLMRIVMNRRMGTYYMAFPVVRFRYEFYTEGIELCGYVNLDTVLERRKVAVKKGSFKREHEDSFLESLMESSQPVTKSKRMTEQAARHMELVGRAVSRKLLSWGPQFAKSRAKDWKTADLRGTVTEFEQASTKRGDRWVITWADGDTERARYEEVIRDLML